MNIVRPVALKQTQFRRDARWPEQEGCAGSLDQRGNEGEPNMKTRLVRILVGGGGLILVLCALCAVPARSDTAILSPDSTEWTLAGGQREFSVSTENGNPLIRSGLTPIVECSPDNARTATLQFSGIDSLALRRCEIPPTVSAALPCATGDTFDVTCAFADNGQRLRFRLMVQQAYRARFPFPVSGEGASAEELGQLADIVGEVLAGLITGFDYSTVLNLIAAVESLSDSLESGTVSVPVARPPTPPIAPPPAPPPFRSQTVEVKSATDESITVATLMTTESGGFTLDGEAFTGGNVTFGDGRTYTLTLADGGWTATFQPREIQVSLGVSRDSVSLYTTEAGGFTHNGTAFRFGETVTARNGTVYRLSLGSDGMWSATAVEP